MNSSTSAISTSDQWTKLSVYVIYMVQGSVVSLGNLLIVAAIARYEALRNNKEYVLIAGLSMADCANMIGILFTGIYRILLLLSGTHDMLKPAWSCLLTVQNIIWSFSMQLSGLMLVVVSLDRLCSVLFPLVYLGWTATTYGSTQTVPAACTLVSVVKQSTNRYYYLYYNLALPCYTFLSVLLYGIVMLVLKKRFNTVVFPEHPNQDYELKRQKKITITLLLSSLCTLLLFVIPFSIAMIFNSLGHYTIALFLWCFCNLNPATNVLIYPLRHKEVRQALTALFKWKHMPADLKMWSPQQVVPAAQMGGKNVRYVPRGARVGPAASMTRHM